MYVCEHVFAKRTGIIETSVSSINPERVVHERLFFCCKNFKRFWHPLFRKHMEHLEIVDASTNKPLGLALPRHEVIGNRLWCRSTNVFVLNNEGAILCHQRSRQKERHPGAWSTHLGGHVSLGETYETNAVKELEEEAGITVEPKHVVAWRTTRISAARLWVREFVTVIDQPAEFFTPQQGEVDQFAWMHLHDIIEASTKQPHAWFAGTHDIITEYQCMRAVLTAASTTGTLPLSDDLHTWHPPMLSVA